MTSHSSSSSSSQSNDPNIDNSLDAIENQLSSITIPEITNGPSTQCSSSSSNAATKSRKWPPLSGLSSITIPEVTNGSSSQCSSSNGATSASETYDDNDVYVHRNDSLIVDDDDELVDSGKSRWVHGTLHVNEVIAVSVSIFRVVFIDCFDD
ncbi:hypothetical protein Tco_0819695 [Tanacetum coccineum]|uniref:Uncharacterized protein n=1 Tax=Tanacetum coccineum TaxID=301880 RepID=A0ABQ5A876_9ASTR